MADGNPSACMYREGFPSDSGVVSLVVGRLCRQETDRRGPDMRRIVTASMSLALAASALALTAPAHAVVNNLSVQCSFFGDVSFSPSASITGAVAGDTVDIGALSGIQSVSVSLSGVTGPATVVRTDSFPVTYTISGSSPSYMLVTVVSSLSGGCDGKSATLSINGGTPSSGGSSSASSAPAPVMQQFGKPASGTCDAAAPTTLNWAGVSSGGWGESWSEWMHGGLGGAVCTRTLVYSESAGAWTVA